MLITHLLLVLEVWDGKPTYRKSWTGNLLVWLDLTLDPSLNFFNVGRARPKEEVIKFWERFGSYSGYKKNPEVIFNVFSMTLALVLGRVDGNSSYNSMGDNWGSHRFAQVKLEFLNTYIFSPSKADISPKQ